MLFQFLSYFFQVEGLLVFAIIILLAYFLLRDISGIPGPSSLPILGYLPFIKQPLHFEFEDLARKYGEIFKVQLGIKKLVVLNTHKLVEEAYNVNKEIAERPELPSFEAYNNLVPVAFTFRPGEVRALRKAAARSLILYSSKENLNLEVSVMKALDSLLSDIDVQIGQAWDPSKAVEQFMGLFAGDILFGMDYDTNHPLVNSLQQFTRSFSKFQSENFGMNFLPFGKLFNRAKTREFQHQMNKTIKIVKDHALAKFTQKSEVSAENPFDITENLIRTLFHAGDVDFNVLFGLAFDIYSAAYSTTSETIVWFLNTIAYHPEVQYRIKEEMATVLGKEAPSLRDKSRLPYLEACTVECFRISSLVPLGVWHCATRDCEVKKYKINRGDIVVSNLWAIHHDKNIFPDPYDYKPDRFITAEGELNNQLVQKVIPFSVGRRKCIGENVARQELFLVFATLLQKYTIRPCSKSNKITDYRACMYEGFTRSPWGHKLVFRNS